MALALSITPDTSGAFLTLRASGGTPPYTVRAYPAGDYPDYQVRTTWVQPTGAPADVRVGIDGGMPLNTATAYQLRDAAGAHLDLAPVTVPATRPILSDATDPTRYQLVTVASQPPNEYAAGSVWWTVLGATDPYVSVAPMRRRNGTLVLYTATRSERAGLLGSLLASGRPLLLRAVCPDAVDDVLFVVTAARDRLTSDLAPSGARFLELDYQVISPELGPVTAVPGRTYADLLVEAVTYADLLALYATYADALTGTPAYTLGPELVTNGTFSAGSTGWSTFWTSGGASWTFSGTALASTTGAGSGVLGPVPVHDATVVAGQTYRIAGRVRCDDAAATVAVQLLTNTTPDPADYFAPGVAYTVAPLTPGSVWAPFAVQLTVPAGDDVGTVYFRADLTGTPGATSVEWDDLSVRLVT